MVGASSGCAGDSAGHARGNSARLGVVGQNPKGAGWARVVGVHDGCIRCRCRVESPSTRALGGESLTMPRGACSIRVSGTSVSRRLVRRGRRAFRRLGRGVDHGCQVEHSKDEPSQARILRRGETLGRGPEYTCRGIVLAVSAADRLRPRARLGGCGSRARSRGSGLGRSELAGGSDELPTFASRVQPVSVEPGAGRGSG